MAKLEVADAITRAADLSPCRPRLRRPRRLPGQHRRRLHRLGRSDAVIDIGALDPDLRPADGQEVELTFSHIRPQPGVGYDERRYVNLWGPATPTGDGLRVAVRRASGWDEADTPFFEYAERGVPAGRDYLDELGARPRLSGLWTFFLATRLPFLTATLIPVGLGGVVAARDNAFHTLWFVLALVAAIAVHLGLNMANDLFDDANGADAANVTPTPFSGGSRVLQYGLVTRRAMVTGCVGALRRGRSAWACSSPPSAAGVCSGSVPWASCSAWRTRRHRSGSCTGGWASPSPRSGSARSWRSGRTSPARAGGAGSRCWPRCPWPCSSRSCST